MKIIKQKIILDESGSMKPQQDTVICAFNEQLESMGIEEKRDNIQYLITLIKFNDTVTVLCKDKPLSDVPKLTIETYSPSGWTAVMDAIGAAIDTAKCGETDVLVTVFSDGQDNRSRTWKKSTIKTLVELRQRENKWGFVFFGCEMNAFSEAASFGISNAVNYTVGNTGSAINAMSMARCSYTMSATNNTYDVNNLTACINKEDLLK